MTPIFRHLISGSLAFVFLGSYLIDSRPTFSATLTTHTLRRTQLAVVWSLILQPGPEGPTLISRAVRHL